MTKMSYLDLFYAVFYAILQQVVAKHTANVPVQKRLSLFLLMLWDCSVLNSGMDRGYLVWRGWMFG